MRITRRLAVLLATAGLLATSMFVGVAGTSANFVSPPGCGDNGIVLTISRSPIFAQPGDVVTYTVFVSNGATASAPAPCDVSGATVTVDLPSPTTGLPSGSPEVLATGWAFPADGGSPASCAVHGATPGVNCGNIGPISRTFTVPPGPLAYGSATAQAALSNALLHSSDFVDDFADTTKSISAAIIDANIQITPSATNEVGTDHTFTAHVNTKVGTAGYVNAEDGTVITFTIDSDTASSLPNPPASCTTSGGTGSCTTTISSATAGVTVVSAHATRSLGGLTVTRHTDGAAGNSGPATKTWVDANIQITPNGTNRVGATHVFTAHVNVNTGTGGFVNAPDGTQILFTIDSGPGGFTTVNPCVTAGGTGSCQISLVSAVPGVTTVSAHTNVTVGGLALTRHTDGTGANSGPAVKTWVNARILIVPNATNEVGQPHTFTVTLQKDLGDGAGFVAFAGAHVDATLTDSGGAVHSAPTGTCTNAGANTDVNGQCQITFTSNSAGQVTGHASWTGTLGTPSAFTVQTDGVAPNSGDAIKTFVDANIQITPNGINRVGATHTFTAHVNVNDGLGGGFVNAPDGTQIAFTIDSGPGAFTTANPCVTAGGTGSCQISLVSAVPGVTVVSAHTNVTVGGLALTRHTDGTGANSGPAVKTWVNARISIAPDATNEIGQPHTFTVTLQRDLGDGAGFVAFPNAHVDFSLTDALGAGSVLDAGASTCDNAGANTDAAGQCVIVFTSPTPGQVTGNASWTGTLGTGVSFTVSTDGVAPNSGPAVKTFVDANIQITPQMATNPVSTNHTLVGHVNVNAGLGGGYVNAPDGTLITFSLVNSGGAAASFVGPNSCTTAGGTGSCPVVISSSTSGTTTVKATTTVVVGGVSLTRTTGDGKLGDSADATKLWADATVRTDVHDAAHNVILTAAPPADVHDKVFVTRTADTPAAVPDPTGNVIFHRYATIDCTGPSVGETVALTPGNPSIAESATFTATSSLCYQAEYLGDANYPARTGAIEPLTVTGNPNIAIKKYTLVKTGGSEVCGSTKSRPTELTFMYTGDAADNNFGTPMNGNSQASGKFIVTLNGVTGTQNVMVILGSGLEVVGGVPAGGFAVGDSFTVKTTSGGSMGTGTVIKLVALDGTVIEDMSIHTSCSAPLLIGDQYLSLNLTGGVNSGGLVTGGGGGGAPCAAPDVLTVYGCDADVAPGPEAQVGDEITWNYVVTNTGDTVLDPVVVSDDHAGVNPAFVSEISGDGDASFEPGEVWLYSATGTAVAGQYANVGTATGTPPFGNPVTDTDPSHYHTPAVVFCDAFGKPTQLVMTWLGTLDNNNTQPAGKAALIFGDASGATNVRIVVTSSSTPGSGTVFFDQSGMNAGDQFTIGDGSTSFGANTYIYVYSSAGVLLQEIQVHTSCSAPLIPGETFWGFQLDGLGNANGTVGVPPVGGGGGGACSLAVTKTEVKDKQLKVEIRNSGTTNAVLTAINNFKWPAANGKLMEIKLGKDSIYKPKGGVAVGASPINLTTADLAADQKKRTINKGHAEKLTFIFEKNASHDLSLYSGATAEFGASCVVNILP